MNPISLVTFLSAASLLSAASSPFMPPEATENLEACRSSDDALVCSGVGRCRDGFCQCDRNYYGVFCECGSEHCPRHEGLVCGGSERGSCECNECVCARGFTGEDCGCSTSVEECLSGDGSICNNRGKCVCNKCQCEEHGIPPTCEFQIRK